MHTLERRLSPRYLREKGTRKAKLVGWQGTARFLELAQRTSVQFSLVGAGAGALWMLLSKRNRSKVTARKVVRRIEKPAVSGLALAATAAKAFLSGARDTKKTGTTRPGRKQAWRGFATAIGAALGSYWYSHRERRV